VPLRHQPCAQLGGVDGRTLLLWLLRLFIFEPLITVLLLILTERHQLVDLLFRKPLSEMLSEPLSGISAYRLGLAAFRGTLQPVTTEPSVIDACSPWCGETDIRRSGKPNANHQAAAPEHIIWMASISLSVTQQTTLEANQSQVQV
jgi:hypothetical protein